MTGWIPGAVQAPPAIRMKFVLMGLFTLVLLAALAQTVDWGELAAAFAGARGFPLFAAFILTLFFPVLNALRWQTVLRAAGLGTSFGRCFQLTMAAWPLGTLTPAKSGEFVKGLAVPNRTLGLGTVLTERVLDILVLGLFGLLAGLWWWHPLAMAGGAFGVLAALGVLLGTPFVLSVLPDIRLRVRLEAFLSVSPMLLSQPRLLLACLLTSGLNWFLSMGQLWYLLAAFGAEMPLGLIVAVLPAAIFVGLLPVTLAGAGTRDAALLVLAGTAAAPAGVLAASVIYTFLGYFLPGFVGLFFLRALTAGRESPEASP